MRQCQYSVPARLIGQRVRVLLRADQLLVFDARRPVAEHERATVRGAQTLVLDHYLEVLARKPGALPGATALAQARAARTFTPAHDAYWAAARARLGDPGGTRALVEVLLLHRHLPAAAVLAGLRAALDLGAVSPDTVAVEARRAAATTPTPAATGSGAQVLTLPTRPAATTVLPADERPEPSVAHYDQLLSRPSSPPAASAAPEGEAVS